MCVCVSVEVIASSYLASGHELKRAQRAPQIGDVVLEVLKGIVDSDLDLGRRGAGRAVGSDLRVVRHVGGWRLCRVENRSCPGERRNLGCGQYSRLPSSENANTLLDWCCLGKMPLRSSSILLALEKMLPTLRYLSANRRIFTSSCYAPCCFDAAVLARLSKCLVLLSILYGCPNRTHLTYRPGSMRCAIV